MLDSARQLSLDLDVLTLVAPDATTRNEAARMGEQSLCLSREALHFVSARSERLATTRSSTSNMQQLRKNLASPSSVRNHAGD